MGQIVAADQPSSDGRRVIHYRAQDPPATKSTPPIDLADSVYAIIPLPPVEEPGLKDVTLAELPQSGVEPFQNLNEDQKQNASALAEQEPEVVRFLPIFAEREVEDSSMESPWASDDRANVRVYRSIGMDYSDMFDEQMAGIKSDFIEYYSPQNLMLMTGGFTAGALMANTGFDEHFMRDTYFDNIVRAPSNELYEALHEPKFLGDGTYTIPAFAALALSGPLLENQPFGPQASEWGQRSLRTILVGAPPMLAAQLLTGASRPGESESSSHWQPFQDNNGVSGHSFMGAIPFISAAKMTDNAFFKSQLYMLSILPALSRVNDDDHYFSQAFLGWWMAYAAASAVDRSYNPDSSYRWNVYPTNGGMGLSFTKTW